jgi:hypothetical protein
MNSLSLKEKGFTEFVPLTGLAFCSLPINQGNILVLADSTLNGKEGSDILYIDRTKKSTRRIFGGYLAGNGSKSTRKINSRLFDDRYIEKVTISWMMADNPKVAQKELLENFKKDHGECPPWNAPKNVNQKTKPEAKTAPKVAKSRPKRKIVKSAI